MKKHLFIPVAMLFFAQHSFAQSTIRTEAPSIAVGTTSHDLFLEHLGNPVTIGLRNGSAPTPGGVFQLNTNGELQLIQRFNNSLELHTNSTERMRLLGDGRVGIGTSAPGQQLSVNGMIETMTGGIMYPDGSIQTTAYLGGGITQVEDYFNGTQYLKVGTGSMFLTGPLAPSGIGGTSNYEIFVNNDDLYIQSNPKSGNYNTLLNAGPNRGFVGIGLTTPTAKMDLELTASNYAEAGARITAPGIFNQSEQGQNLGLIHNPDLFVVRRRHMFGSGFKPYFHIKSNGLVGVGTDTPDAHFHIVDNNGTDVDAHIEGFTLIDGNQASLMLGAETGASHGEWGLEYNHGAGGLNFWKPFGATTGGGNYHLFIKNNGKVSIGLDPTLATTFNGNYKLYVADGIMTEKVRVAIKTTADWMDVVFDDSYDLLSLDEVEEFIDKNKHLPGVPSAEDVVSEGIDIAEMDATLLKKIEELTLYMIELKQENEAIKKELKELKGE